MFNDIICKSKNLIKKYSNLVIITLITFGISVVLGLFLIGSKNVKEPFEQLALSYFNKIICKDFDVFDFLISNIISLTVIFAIFIVLPINKITFYISLVVVVYNGYVFGVFLNIFIFNLGIIGITIFIFTILVKYFFIMLATIIFMVFSLDLIELGCNKLENVLKITIFAYLIAIIGVFIELVMILVILRPTNLCF